MKEHDYDYCGCCGRACEYTSISEPWCSDCKEHVSNKRLPPWERTYDAQHGTECPYQVAELSVRWKQQ